MHGQGTFSQTMDCLDHKSGEPVALKVYRNTNLSNNAGLYEVDIMLDMFGHDDSECLAEENKEAE